MVFGGEVKAIFMLTEYKLLQERHQDFTRWVANGNIPTSNQINLLTGNKTIKEN